MATINMILQGKGGVGKSFIASLIAQSLLDKGIEPICVDTDPVNTTFAGYRAFDVDVLDIMDGDIVDPTRFDSLIEQILELPPNAQMVVDNGAATFLPLTSYLFENAVIPLLKENGHHVRLHSVVTGGQAKRDTLSGLTTLLKNFPGLPLVVWLNPFFGPIVRTKGKNFEDYPIYQENIQNFEAVIRLPDKSKAMSGKDLEKLLTLRMTFAEANESDEFGLMQRQRLTLYWREFKQEMDKANL